METHIALLDAANREDTIYRSKAVGEPPLMLAISAFHAIRDAVASCGPKVVCPSYPPRRLPKLYCVRSAACGRRQLHECRSVNASRRRPSLAEPGSHRCTTGRQRSSALCKQTLRSCASSSLRYVAPRRARWARACSSNAARILGTIGGGQLEWTAIAAARALLTQPSRAAVEMHKLSLGPQLSQCCGGAVELWLERYTARDISLLSAAAEAATRGPTVIVTSLDRRRRAQTIIESPDIRAGARAELIREGDVTSCESGWTKRSRRLVIRCRSRRPGARASAGHPAVATDLDRLATRTAAR